MNPVLVDSINRYGGTCSPDMQWPAEAAQDAPVTPSCRHRGRARSSGICEVWLSLLCLDVSVSLLATLPRIYNSAPKATCMRGAPASFQTDNSRGPESGCGCVRILVGPIFAVGSSTIFWGGFDPSRGRMPACCENVSVFSQRSPTLVSLRGGRLWACVWGSSVGVLRTRVLTRSAFHSEACALVWKRRCDANSPAAGSPLCPVAGRQHDVLFGGV